MTASLPIPSATVVLVRDGNGGPEILLLQRSGTLDFHGGAWVFPGGRIDDVDRASDPIEAARRAAVREVHEETGLRVTTSELLPFSRWTTPAVRPKRFETWFFVARAPAGTVKVDGGEITTHRWLTPCVALSECAGNALTLPPPTFVTLTVLARFDRTEALLHHVRSASPEKFEPRPVPIEGGFCSLYHPDAGFETGELTAPGPRHRLWVVSSGWRYERDF